MLELLPTDIPSTLEITHDQIVDDHGVASLHQTRQIYPWKPKIHRFNRGDQLPNSSDSIWQITEGYVRSITWTDDGIITTLGIWGCYDCAGSGLSIVNPYQLECLTPVTAVRCSYPMKHMHAVLLNHMQQTEKLLFLSHHRQISERLLALLRWLAARFGDHTPSGNVLNMAMTHQQLADLAGTTRVTMTRLLNQLEREGQIQRLPKRQILICPRANATIS